MFPPLLVARVARVRLLPLASRIVNVLPVVASVALFATPASADDARDSSAAGGGGAGAGATEARAEVASPDVVRETNEARAELEGALSHMSTTSRHVRDLLRATRNGGSPRQVACVDEGLSRADVALRMARAATEESLLAYGRSDLATARVARHRVAELAGYQRIAARDASVCKPNVLASIRTPPTGTRVEVSVDPHIARPSL